MTCVYLESAGHLKEEAMPSRRKFTLSSGEVHAYAACWLQPLRLKERGTKCTREVFIRVLFLAAARISSVGAVCQALTKGPCVQAVYDALAAMLPASIDVVGRRLNACLQSQLPKQLTKRRQVVAIDLTLIAYHGQPHADPQELFHGKAKSGTTKFHAYATAYVCQKGCRYTLAVRRVTGGVTMKEVVQDLVRQIRGLGLKIKVLLLDRGFYSVAVMRYLRRTKCPFVMPAVVRGRKPAKGKPLRGMRAVRNRAIGWYRETVRSENDVIDIAVCVAGRRYTHRKTNKQRLKKLLYVAWGYHASPIEIRELYRKRFAIETTYRQMNQARIRTCTRDPLERLVYFTIALILRNVWVWLHGTLLFTYERGKLVLRLQLLRFREMLNWLAHETIQHLHDATPYTIEWNR
jgi:putative transposase